MQSLPAPFGLHDDFLIAIVHGGTMKLSRDSSLDDIFMHLETRQVTTLLFVDQTDYCSAYSQQPWIELEAEVIEVDQEIVDHFQIGKVPQFRFYVRGSEVADLSGTVARDEIIDIKKRMFGDLIYPKLNSFVGGKNGTSDKK